MLVICNGHQLNNTKLVDTKEITTKTEIYKMITFTFSHVMWHISKRNWNHRSRTYKVPENSRQRMK